VTKRRYEFFFLTKDVVDNSRSVINVREREFNVRDTPKILNGKVSRICRNRKRTHRYGERVLVPSAVGYPTDV